MWNIMLVNTDKDITCVCEQRANILNILLYPILILYSLNIAKNMY